MEIHATWLTSAHKWYITNAKTGEILRKIGPEEYEKYRLWERKRHEILRRDVPAQPHIGLATALGGKILVATIDGLGYIALETKNWERKWRIPAVPVRAAIMAEWPEYVKKIQNLEEADKLYDDEKTIKKLIRATIKANTMHLGQEEYLWRPTISDDRYLLVSTLNEWKIYDLKTGEWIGRELVIAPIGCKIRTPIGNTQRETLKMLLSIVKEPNEILYRALHKGFKQRASFLPKGKRILIVNDGYGDWYMIVDGETGEIINRTSEGYDGWPLNPLKAAIECGIFDEYDIPRRKKISEMCRKDVVLLSSYAWGPNNEVAIGITYIKEPVKENRSIRALMIFDEKGRLIEHVALIETGKEGIFEVHTVYRNGSTIAEVKLWKEPFIWSFLEWYPKPYIIGGGALAKTVYWPSRKIFKVYRMEK